MNQEQPIPSVLAIENVSEEITAAEPPVDVVLTADQIQKQMATVREQIHERSDEVVTSTKELADWRFYVRRHPWASVTAAAVIGYAIVPLKAKAGGRGSTREIKGKHGALRDNELKSVLFGAAKRAVVTHASKTLGDVFSGFFTADDAA